MGTKNNPGKYDCYQQAEPDEPMFVLLGRDPAAPFIVSMWVAVRREMGEDITSHKLDEARSVAYALEAWGVSKGNRAELETALDAWRRVLLRAASNVPPVPTTWWQSVLLAAAHSKYLAGIKLAAGCMDCGYKKHPAALDFDHRPRTKKKWHISAMAGRSPKLIVREIAKCDIVCANCHRIRTYNRRRADGGKYNKELARKISLARRKD